MNIFYSPPVFIFKNNITLQSECPQTITCLISLCTHPSSKAAGSHVVYSSRKCCECGIKFPAFRTKYHNIKFYKL